MKQSKKPAIAAVFLLLAMPNVLFGYIGPGAGLTIIGAALAFIASIVLGVFGFIWYPIKRLAKALGRKSSDSGQGDA
jgi:hypothetical protein